MHIRVPYGATRCDFRSIFDVDKQCFSNQPVTKPMMRHKPCPIGLIAREYFGHVTGQLLVPVGDESGEFACHRKVITLGNSKYRHFCTQNGGYFGWLPPIPKNGSGPVILLLCRPVCVVNTHTKRLYLDRSGSTFGDCQTRRFFIGGFTCF